MENKSFSRTFLHMFKILFASFASAVGLFIILSVSSLFIFGHEVSQKMVTEHMLLITIIFTTISYPILFKLMK